MKQGVRTIVDKLSSWVTHFDFPGRLARIKEIEDLMMDDKFWDDRRTAQSLIDEMNTSKDVLESYDHLTKRYSSMEETVDMLKDDFDEEMASMVEDEVTEANKEYETFEVKLLLSHPYDKNNAILELHPGAGGTESQDWAELLYRMYTRWAENKGWKVSVLDYLEGEEAGIKSVTFLVEGNMAYGYLKAEKGVHRLVRISPFDSSGRRHTSFCSLDVCRNSMKKSKSTSIRQILHWKFDMHQVPADRMSIRYPQPCV